MKLKAAGNTKSIIHFFYGAILKAIIFPGAFNTLNLLTIFFPFSDKLMDIEAAGHWLKLCWVVCLSIFEKRIFLVPNYSYQNKI